MGSFGWKIDKSKFSWKKLVKNKKKELFRLNSIYQNLLENSLHDVFAVIILAGLVGDPITKKYPELSNNINNIGIKKVLDLLVAKVFVNLIQEIFALLVAAIIPQGPVPVDPSLHLDQKQVPRYLLFAGAGWLIGNRWKQVLLSRSALE